MPRANSLKKIPYRSGSSLNITAGTHKYTFTFGRMTKQAEALYEALTYENRLRFDQDDIADIYSKTRPNVSTEQVNLALEEQRRHAMQQKTKYKEPF